MKRILFTLFVPFILLSVFSCSRDGRIIPRNKMSDIYADMFLADQWIARNFKSSRTADTAFVYEAVFRKYGYDSDDYRKSVEHYIQDPDKFTKILRRTVTILDERISEKKAELKKLRALESAEQDDLIQFDFSRIWIFENGYPRLTVRDSLDYFRGRQEYFIMDLKPLAEFVNLNEEDDEKNSGRVSVRRHRQ